MKSKKQETPVKNRRLDGYEDTELHGLEIKGRSESGPM